ncbi:hypothetical protein CBS101457_003504 [Exobasidium rhododendri]|nr:hypothetical protein CBS101457_003504 [Exobasidium rhododendri]
MSISEQQSIHNNIDTQHSTHTRTNIATPAQHEYLPQDDPYISEDVFSLEAVEEDTINFDVTKEGASTRATGRKARAKHARRPFQYDNYYEEDDSSSSEEGDPHSVIVTLPTEILSRILAYLDPHTLLGCTRVCKAFAGVVKDEATWRLAFGLAFRVENVGVPTTPALRRVDSINWRGEYIRRTELLRRWRKARSPTVISDTRISTIHAIALSVPHHFLLSASESFGIASRCDPFSGKVSKGFVDASGQLNGLGVGGHQHHLAMEQIGEEVSSICLESDASRIIWGYQNGDLGMTTLARQGTNPRGAIKGVRFSSRGSHSSAILNIALPFGTARGGVHSIERSPEKLRQRHSLLGDAAELFATAGMDGTVRLWSPKKALPLWVDVVQHNFEHQAGLVYKRPDPVVCVDLDIGAGIIAAATSEGQVTVWTDIDCTGLTTLPSTAFEDEPAMNPSAVSMESQAELKRLRQRIKRIQMPPLRVYGKDGDRAPCMLALETESTFAGKADATERIFSARLLVFCLDGSSFERIDIKRQGVEEPTLSSLVFTTPNNSTITILRPDFDLGHLRRGSHATASVEHALYAERRYVCAGTSDGRLIIWDWDQQADAAGGPDDRVGAWSTLDGHHTTISAIDFTAHVIVIGCSDGTIKAFCPLTGQLIRTFNDRTATRHPARMLAAGELTEEEASRFHVSQIIVGPDMLVASIGGQVLAWKAEKVKGKMGKRPATKLPAGRSSIGRLWDPKLQSQKEMERDVFETKELLKKEQEDREEEYERIKYSVGGRSELEIGGLSEQEAFEYAMMLSRDEQEASVEKEKKSLLQGGSTEGLQDALEQIALAESSEDVPGTSSSRRPSSHDARPEDFETTSAIHSKSLSPSPISSPNLSGLSSPPSRAWDILQQAGSSASPISRNQEKWHPNNKVSIISVPQSARNSSSRSSTSMTRRPSISQATPPGLDNTQDWPSFEPGSFNSHSPGQWQLGSPVVAPVAPHISNSKRPSHTSSCATSPVFSPSPTLLPVRNAIGAWAGGSPSFRPAKDPSQATSIQREDARKPSSISSSEAQSRLPSPPANHDDTEEDDDLKFVIELSLAEERSRQAQ